MLFAGSARVEAGTPSREKPGAFKVALQPFSVVHSAIDSVAAPVVHDAPRQAFAPGTAPVRIAYNAVRAERADIPRDGRAGEEDIEEPEISSIYDNQRARIAQRPDSGEAVRVAYVVPRSPIPPVPRAEPVDHQDADERSTPPCEETEEESAQFDHGSRPMVDGSRAVLRRGIAYAPSEAPQAVKNAIWAANTLRNKPYVWGGGHGSFYDRGYDCSGTVSFALHAAGAIGSPIPSSDLRRYGERGRGRWFTIYSRNGHTFAVIAGLRLDTTDFANGGDSGPRWHTDMRDTGGYVVRHPARM
ncbi:MAG: hypothetical protein H0X73_03140 [Chthoniobacterales bacterium]|nr:hypothetical protein [Chthoniobacterales bacterium]